MPQNVAEVMDLRRLLLLHNKVETATTWSGSRECAKPNPNPVRRIKIIDRSIDMHTIYGNSNTFLSLRGQDETQNSSRNV